MRLHDTTVSRDSEPTRRRPVFMHPVIFVAAFTLLGLLFASQEWMNMHHSGYKIGPAIVFETWGLQYFIWGVFCWSLWRLFRAQIQTANTLRILTIVAPISVVACLIEELIWTASFPQVPLDRGQMAYWPRVLFNFKGDIVESMAIFWSAFFLCRGLGYYQQLRDKEHIAMQLEAQLANAQIAALRMQLNPHFLFNTMNSISSLMRIDIDAADTMLEQLSSLLRMTLQRRDLQLIPLHDEIEFTETYLGMQDQRYLGRVARTFSVDPELYDALVPAMFLQPIVENAFVHGLSKLERGGKLSIEISRQGEHVKVVVRNSGLGLDPDGRSVPAGHGMGLMNVKNRLHLHYADDCSFSIEEIDRRQVQVSILFPLQLSPESEETLTRYGL